MTDQFIIDEDDRYSRFRLIAWWDQEKLRAARVLVVGAGALGNEVLKNLALLGVGSVLVIDMDTIEDSNLTRSVLFRSRDCGKPKAAVAATAAQDINPDMRIAPLQGNVITDVGLGLFRDADVVIGCLDNREARLWVNRNCWKVGTPWIDGGIQEINGVVKVFVPPDSACYECGMTENDYRLINLRYSCPLLRREDIMAGKVPTAPTISSMIAGLQTQEALKLLHGLPVDAGQAMIYNGMTNQFYKTAFQRKDDCLSHEVYSEIVVAEALSVDHTPRDLFAWLSSERLSSDQLSSEPGTLGAMMLRLHHDLVLSMRCHSCQVDTTVMLPLPKVSMNDAICSECGETRKPETAHTISADSRLANQTFAQLGVPPYDIVRVACCAGGDADGEQPINDYDDNEVSVLLAGDANFREVCGE